MAEKKTDSKPVILYKATRIEQPDRNWWERPYRLDVDDLVARIAPLVNNQRTGVYTPGYAHYFVGPMFSEKTGNMMSYLRKARYVNTAKTQIFKPYTDDRVDPDHIYSRSDGRMKCTSLQPDQPEGIVSLISPDTQIVAIDEAQFFDPTLVDVVRALRRSQRHVFASMLPADFRGEPFPTAMYLMTDNPNKIETFTAACTVQPCPYEATMTQRLIKKMPADWDDPVVLTDKKGKKEKYTARCLFHHQVTHRKKEEEALAKQTLGAAAGH